MKRLFLTCCFTLVAIFAFTQAPPQAICYQAVATDASGMELLGETIEIKTSILKGSFTGTAVWIETHTKTTDDFGLFELAIGEGTAAGGTLGGFNEIDWSGDIYFLKVEMALNNSGNFLNMGTNQILSVPYALFSDKANYADTANISNVALFADSAAVAHHAQIADMSMSDFDTDPENELQDLVYDDSLGVLTIEGGNSVALSLNDLDSDPENELQSLEFDGSSLSLVNPDGSSESVILFTEHLFSEPGASFDYPQGILGDHKILTMGIYTVPPGKTFYTTSSEEHITFSHPNLANGALIEHPTTPNMPVFPAGSVLSNCRCTGFEVDTTSIIEPIIIDLSDTGDEYVIPNGKVLFLKSGLMNDFSGYLKVNGTDFEFFRPNLSRWSRVVTLPAGTTLQKPNQPDFLNSFVLTGYLIDN